MAWLRRRRGRVVALPETDGPWWTGTEIDGGDQEIESVVLVAAQQAPSAPSAAPAVVVRVERALAALVVQAAQLEARMGRLERRLDEQGDAVLDLPTHVDVLDVRLHSARVSAELARVAFELRAELAMAAEPQRPRVSTIAEQVADVAPAPPAPIAPVLTRLRPADVA